MTRYQHLDALRGLSILFVILYHTYARWPEHLPAIEVTKEFVFFKYGYLGVNVFFMISGFVIFLSLDKSKSFIDFLKKRWSRLFPAMLISSVIILFLSFVFPMRPHGSPDLLDIIPGIFFINHNIINPTFRS
ncbi:acyltransferase family protein, partial [Vibrio breoganii]